VIVERAAAVLAEHGIEDPRTDAEWIVSHALGIPRSQLALAEGVDDTAVWPLVQRRTLREPLAYVLGEWGFRRLTVHCDARALVPRPETEQVVERCLALLKDVTTPRVLDVGTGSGAIALALADELTDARVVATDASAGALSLARENANRLYLAVRFVHADLTLGLPPGPFDLVVSNPPYVPAGELAALEPEVREWEPREALVDTGQTQAFVAAALAVLAPNGVLVLEVHEDDPRRVAASLEEAGYRDVRITRDLAGRDRVVEARVDDRVVPDKRRTPAGVPQGGRGAAPRRPSRWPGLLVALLRRRPRRARR
jgi:release factor glutamine methyltransferase